MLPYRVLLESLLPPGSVWKPKRLVEVIDDDTELLTNGGFTTDLSGWAINEVENIDIRWSGIGGSMILESVNIG